MPKKDLIGLKFGKLTVIKDTNKRADNGSIIWLCRCDCGNYCERPGNSLTRKTLKNIYCGKCSYTENLIGKKFNHLTVIDYTNKRSNGKVVWLCECDCGNPNKVFVSTSNLKNGSVKSCGCLNRSIQNQQFIDISNQKFNKLIALEYLPNNKWKCQCDCGNIIEVTYSDLINNRVKHCGNDACISRSSQGEEIIENILKNNNIQYEKQKIFQTCRFPITNALARFDFYLPKLNILIEYDGEQHFQDIEKFSSQKETLERDNFKNQWANQNNIKLIRIPYYQKLMLNDKFLLDLLN